MANAVAIAAFVILVLWASSKVVAVISSPLNVIPNAHFTAPFSGLWIMWTRARGREFSTRLAAHRRLGPVIRLGPQELGIDCLEDGVRTVYGRSWDKTSMYDMFTNYGFLPLFAISGAKPHAERKRVFTHVFSKSTISTSVEFREILDVIGHDRLQPRLHKLARDGTTANMFSLTREYSMDVVTAYIYGLDKSTNWLDNPTEASRYLSAFRDTGEAWEVFALSEVPKLVDILHRIGINIISPSFFSSLETLQSFVFDLTSDAIGTLQADDNYQDASSRPLHQMWQRLDDMPETQKACLLASDAFDQLHAGHESTGILLTFMMWELSRNNDIQDKLRKELRFLRNAGQSPEQSQFLDDVVTETIRLYPAAGGPFPRVAPPNAKVAGFNIPAKSIVSAVPYTLGRNLEFFPDPESWLPERWTGTSDEEKRQMKEWVWAFLSGSRICIAEYLAMRVMKSFIVEVYSDYKTTIATESDMRQLETWFAIPADSALYLAIEAY